MGSWECTANFLSLVTWTFLGHSNSERWIKHVFRVNLRKSVPRFGIYFMRKRKKQQSHSTKNKTLLACGNIITTVCRAPLHSNVYGHCTISVSFRDSQRV